MEWNFWMKKKKWLPCGIPKKSKNIEAVRLLPIISLASAMTSEWIFSSSKMTFPRSFRSVHFLRARRKRTLKTITISIKTILGSYPVSIVSRCSMYNRTFPHVLQQGVFKNCFRLFSDSLKDWTIPSLTISALTGVSSNAVSISSTMKSIWWRFAL